MDKEIASPDPEPKAAPPAGKKLIDPVTGEEVSKK